MPIQLQSTPFKGFVLIVANLTGATGAAVDPDGGVRPWIRAFAIGTDGLLVPEGPGGGMIASPQVGLWSGWLRASQTPDIVVVTATIGGVAQSAAIILTRLGPTITLTGAAPPSES